MTPFQKKIAMLKIGIITSSDRGSRGEYDFLSGEAILSYLQERLESPFEHKHVVVPDEQPLLEKTLKELSDEMGCALILTTGGTGPAPRDVTPEATEAVCYKMLPGFGEEMRRVSMSYVKTAFLSRQTAGIRGKSLIINLPGKPRSIKQCLDAIIAGLPHAVFLIGDWELHLKP